MYPGGLSILFLILVLALGERWQDKLMEKTNELKEEFEKKIRKLEDKVAEVSEEQRGRFEKRFGEIIGELRCAVIETGSLVSELEGRVSELEDHKS